MQNVLDILCDCQVINACFLGRVLDWGYKRLDPGSSKLARDDTVFSLGVVFFGAGW